MEHYLIRGTLSLFLLLCLCSLNAYLRWLGIFRRAARGGILGFAGTTLFALTLLW